MESSKVVMEFIRDKKEFKAMKRHEQKNDRSHKAEKKLSQPINTAEIHMLRKDSCHMVRDTQDVGRQRI